MYNEGELTKWTAPIPAGGELPSRVVHASYNIVEYEIPSNSVYSPAYEKVEITSNIATRTYNTRMNFDNTTLKVFWNGERIYEYSISGINSFTINSSMIGQTGWIWAKYNFRSTEYDAVYTDGLYTGICMRRIGAQFKAQLLREICSVVNKAERYIGMSETMWLGGKYNSKFGSFDLIGGKTPLSEEHFTQIANSVNGLLETTSRTIGQLNLTELLIEESEIPSNNSKIATEFIEKCRMSLTKVEEVLISV